jgi:hypothetical protein
MDNSYKAFKKKLEKLKIQNNQAISRINQKARKKSEMEKQTRIINLTEIKINQEQKNLVELGPNYKIEKTLSNT